LTGLPLPRWAIHFDVMSVKEPGRALVELAAELDSVSARTRAALLAVHDSPGITVRELADRFSLSEEALVAFAETAGELLGERELDPQTARRAALIAVSGQAWENELGPLLSGLHVRTLLGGVSRQRIGELLQSQRLIGLRDGDGRRRFPAFQFVDGQPVEPIISAFWVVAEGTVSEWTAGAWCVAPDEGLDGETPAAWARAGGDPERLLRVARQDRARLSQ
jgi:hypothetical protein